MARKPTTDTASQPKDPRQAAIDALLALAAEKPWNAIGLGEIAGRAGLTLAELRTAYPSKGAILAAFSRQVDAQVLEDIDPAMAAEPARERLFDVLMRRLDILAPHKEAVRGIADAIGRDPLALGAWNRVVVTAMQWMLTAAGIEADGPMGAARAQALAVAWGRIVRTWLDDADEGQGRTMKEIDRQLRTGERWLRYADDVWRLAAPLRRAAERSMHRRSRLREKVRERFSDFAAGRRPAREEGTSDVL